MSEKTFLMTEGNLHKFLLLRNKAIEENLVSAYTDLQAFYDSLPTTQAPVVPSKADVRRIRGRAWESCGVHHEDSGFDEGFWDRFYDELKLELTLTHQQPVSGVPSERKSVLKHPYLKSEAEREALENLTLGHQERSKASAEVCDRDRTVAREILDNCHQSSTVGEDLDRYIDHEEVSQYLAGYREEITKGVLSKHL